MDSGYYAAMTGLVARTQALDTAAATWPMHRPPAIAPSESTSVPCCLDPKAKTRRLGQAVNRYGLLGGDRLSMAQGPLQQTGNPLDLAIEGDRILRGPNCQWDSATRAMAAFIARRTGSLVTAANEPVLSSTRQPISIPPGEVAIGASGVISVSGGAVATVGIFRFPDDDGNSGRRAPIATPLRTASADSLSGDGVIHQGALEGANQDVVQGTLDLIMMQRQAEMMQKALTVFHTEFNKTATEDLPRV